MSQTDLRDSVRAEIEARCGGDASQCSAIFSPSKRVFVEAPAGYGKTTVMTGRACWLLASGEVHPPKRILALTFSVAAAAEDAYGFGHHYVGTSWSRGQAF